MKPVIIDNYDSFTYNLSQILQELGAEVTVLRNDKFLLEDLEAYDKIVLSPGPGIPEEAGLLLDVIRSYAGKKPILGICLGEQAIGEVFGGKLVNLSSVFHGIQSPVDLIADDYLFQGLPRMSYSRWRNAMMYPSLLRASVSRQEGKVSLSTTHE